MINNTNNAYSSIEQRWSMFEILNEKSFFDEHSINEAMLLFEKHKIAGLFLNDSFEDEEWLATDEYQHKSIQFDVNRESYRLSYESALGISYEKFIDYLKTYIIFCVGELVITTMVLIVNDVKKIIELTPSSLSDSDNVLSSPAQVEGFFEALPCDNAAFIEELTLYTSRCAEDIFSNSSLNRRELCDFLSYFRFGYIMEDFWHKDISDDDRLFYYPLYLWWKITGVIPTRPREFLLMPRNCLHRSNGQNLLTLRKNCLKGSNKTVKYNIDQDYIKVTYPVSDEIADAVENYINLTDSCEDNELHTLFRTEPHFKKFNQPKHCTSRFYTYANLNCTLRLFHYNVIKECYGMNVYRSKGMTDFSYDTNNIQYINLGDTRHLSMINAIAEGCSPEIVMQMAGHDSIDMSSHYYANMSTYIECRTYARYMKTLSEQHYIMGSNFYAPVEVEDYIELEDGAKCYSKAMKSGDIKDCIAASGDNGEIGYCPRCTYYRAGNLGYFLDSNDMYKNKIDLNMNYLQKLIKLARSGKGLNDDIKETLLQFKSNKHDFEQYLIEKFNYNLQEKRNGKTT